MKYNETLTEKIRKGEAAFEFDHSRKEESIDAFKLLFPLDFRAKKTGDISHKYYWLEKRFNGVATASYETALPIITLTQLLEEEEIEGYVLKEECKQYEEAVNIILTWHCGKLKCFDRYDFQHNSPNHQRLQQAGVLDLWFNKVYKKKFKVDDIIVAFCLTQSYIGKYTGEPENETVIKEYYPLKSIVGNPANGGHFAYIERHATEEEKKQYEAAKKAAEKIIIGDYEVVFYPDNTVKIHGVYYTKQDLAALQSLMNRGQIKSLNCGCSGQYKVDLETINMILERMKQL